MRERPAAPRRRPRQNRRMDFELDDDPARIQRDAVWRWLSTEAYWGRWRSRADLDAQIDSAWRLVGVYAAGTGAQVGFARAVSDGVAFAYLADVYVEDAHRGHGLGKALVRRMVDEGPGSGFRWVLFTGDAHGLYEGFGFTEPDGTAMVRRAAPHRR
jgi:GNAT superfamily N-acetyltransferase